MSKDLGGKGYSREIKEVNLLRQCLDDCRAATARDARYGMIGVLITHDTESQGSPFLLIWTAAASMCRHPVRWLLLAEDKEKLAAGQSCR